VSAYAICDNISAKGLGGGAWSGFVDPPSSDSSESRRSRDAAVTFLVTFASRRTPGLPRTATGAASAKLMMESTRMARVSILCCRIFVG
jgi:hypothetical protein